ncbi:TolB family protein [Pleurocapsa sp. PCC 7319]|uniref:TolB family protein n=1 Tax=Pleurocapsa sp. PCC 7319 TaxID=118161 RepID=UPI00034539B6|nr:TolB family protein [Pleurocapsa sp. PCC 7319]
MLRKFLPLLVLTLIGGCNSSLLIQNEVIPGGVNSNSPEEYPAYSPDGRYLAFASDRRGQRDIFLYDLQVKQLLPLPNLNRRDSTQDQPALSNDGRYIVYVSTERGKADIFVYDRQQQKSELLTANIKGSSSHPTINGNGSQIAFQASQLGQWKIVIIVREVEENN